MALSRKQLLPRVCRQCFVCGIWVTGRNHFKKHRSKHTRAQRGIGRRIPHGSESELFQEAAPKQIEEDTDQSLLSRFYT